MPKIGRWLYTLSFGCTCIGGVVLFKDYTGGKRYSGKEKALGITAVVTGANNGIGQQVVSGLATRGARVIMACKDMKSCEKMRTKIVTATYNPNIVCKHCDLSDLKSVKAFCDAVCEKEKRVDVLINNAAVMRLPKHKMTKDGFEMHLGVNHLGHFYLTNRLLDKLKQSEPARIINVNCPSHRLGAINYEDLNSVTKYDPGDAYNQSKLALMLFHKELAKRLSGSDVTVMAMNPGNVRSKLGRHMGINSSWISGPLLGPLTWLIFRTPRQGAETILYLALSKEVDHSKNGFYFKDQEPIDVAENVTETDARRMWAISESWTKERSK